jgi:hypothetical protein
MRSTEWEGPKEMMGLAAKDEARIKQFRTDLADIALELASIASKDDVTEAEAVGYTRFLVAMTIHGADVMEDWPSVDAEFLHSVRAARYVLESSVEDLVKLAGNITSATDRAKLLRAAANAIHMASTITSGAVWFSPKADKRADSTRAARARIGRSNSPGRKALREILAPFRPCDHPYKVATAVLGSTNDELIRRGFKHVSLTTIGRALADDEVY